MWDLESESDSFDRIGAKMRNQMRSEVRRKLAVISPGTQIYASGSYAPNRLRKKVAEPLIS